MEKLSYLFYKCAYLINYQVAGEDTDYAFTEEDSTLYIWFKGSDSKYDWKLNFSFWRKPYKDMKIPYSVHGGFLKAWKNVEDIIINKITEVKKIKGADKFVKYYKYDKIVIVGYSHGGALSGLCHECVWYWRNDIKDNIFGYGFESPRFYHGLSVNKKLQERWKNYTVIRTHTDIVTHTPPRLFGFTHVGKLLWLKPSDTSKYRLPKFIGSHYPDTVHAALIEYENRY